MTKVAIQPEDTVGGCRMYRAVAGDNHSLGVTAGDALDALSDQLPADETDMLVIIRYRSASRAGRRREAVSLL